MKVEPEELLANCKGCRGERCQSKTCEEREKSTNPLEDLGRGVKPQEVTCSFCLPRKVPAAWSDCHGQSSCHYHYDKLKGAATLLEAILKGRPT